MIKKKELITNAINENYSKFSNNTMMFDEVINYIRTNNWPIDFDDPAKFLKNCLHTCFTKLEDKLATGDLALIHHAALQLISVNDDTYTPRTYKESFHEIYKIFNEGQEDGFLNFKDTDIMQLLKEIGNDYIVILLKLAYLEPHMGDNCYDFTEMLIGYTGFVGLDSVLSATYYNSKVYKDFMYKLQSVKSGGTSQRDEVKEKREALIKEITMETINLIDADDSISIEERAKKIPSIVDDIVEKINKRTEVEINIALEEEFPQWKTEVESRKKRHSKRETQIAELKISSRRARRLVREAWEKQHATNIEN